MPGNLYIGTSGWAYKEWKPDFYPDGVPQKRWLEAYATQLHSCEINATFYRMQAPTTFEKWASQTPEDFRFTSKAHRMITHSRGWEPNERRVQFIKEYYESLATLGTRLGAVLLQFPTHRDRDDAGLASFLEAMPSDPPWAAEFRSESWDHPDVAARVAEAGGTVCVSETEGKVPAALPPGPLAYVRLRTDRYGESARAGWLELLAQEAASRPVYVFTKHEGIPVQDSFGGVGLARWLSQRAPAPEDEPGRRL